MINVSLINAIYKQKIKQKLNKQNNRVDVCVKYTKYIHTNEGKDNVLAYSLTH